MSTIQQQNGIFYIDIQYNNHPTLIQQNIRCWLPLKDLEPPNKKSHNFNKLSFRTAQRSRGGYYQMNGGTDVHVHMYKANNPQVETVLNMDYHVSHLCHHWWCCNPAHLVNEPAWVNMFRKTCLLNHGGECDCNLLCHPRYKDQNIPKCIWGGGHGPNHVYMEGLSEKDKRRVKELTGKGCQTTLSAFVNNL